jgi:hypothetical protein
MSPNSANNALNTVLKTLDVLHRDLTAAQHGPMEPRLRSELTRLAKTTANSSAKLADAHQAAAGQIAAKKEAAAALAAANKAAIAAKQAAAQQPAAIPPKPVTPPIDPTLGKLLADELLGRQPNRTTPEPPKHNRGVLDAWDWRTTAQPILQ